MAKVYDFKQGEVLCFDKPLKWTSFQVVKHVRFLIAKRLGLAKSRNLKVGHAGTLDPLASGVMMICTGKATKRIEELQSMPKTYTGTFVLGATTASYDLEHPVEPVCSVEHFGVEAVTSACADMKGVQQQVPPLFSAVKLDGRSAFQYARKGEEVALKSKEIEIYDFRLPRVELPEVDFEIRCSKGTYIRSVARDLGAELGCGAYLKRLRRTSIGEFSVGQALPLAAYFADGKRGFTPHRKRNFDV
ncbi:MAG: tRNA pseudouridine(55) synthase TruB [Bacteroidales bacterium]|nr:tRNA pseudouridine(55) synthase TruB [Bacteroidales bacterium]